MYRRPVVDAGQGVSEVDFGRFGQYPQDGAALTTADLLYSGMCYSGLLTTAVGDGVNISVAPGRLYSSGVQYALETAQVLSLASFVPVISGQAIICLVVAQGQEVQDDLENRYYERAVDPSNPNAGTQQTVDDGYRTMNRKVVLSVFPGAQSARPVAPTAPTNSIPVSQILLTSSGIQTITQRTDTQATRLDTVSAAQAALAASLVQINQAIDGLRSDIAATRADLMASASTGVVAALASDVALIKNQLDLPDNGSPYWADRFMTYGESDWNPVSQTGNVDFSAQVSEGVRFDFEAINEFPLSILNPNDPNLALASSGYICPAYTDVPGIVLDAATATTPLGGVNVQTISIQTLTASRQRIRLGTSFDVCTNSTWWQSGSYDPISGIFKASNGDTYQAAFDPTAGVFGLNNGTSHVAIRLQQIFTDSVAVNYDKYIANSTTISGVTTAQSFLQHQERWVTGVDLAVARWGAGAQIVATLCECRDDGTPNPARALSSVTLADSQFKAWPEWTQFTFAAPVLTSPLASADGGARGYAILWQCTGDVDVETSDGNNFLAGNRFTTTDGIYFVGDLAKDTCFRVRYAHFTNTTMPIRLGAWNLSGGIQDIDILAPMLVPGSANAVFQVNVGGTWKSLDATAAGASFLNGTQALYDAQILMTGTEWGMPVVNTANSRVRLSRPKSHFDWISSAWIPGQTTTKIAVRAVAASWDAARHTISAKLRYGSTFGSVKSPTATAVVTVVPGRAVETLQQCNAVYLDWVFDFTGSPLSSTDAVKIEFIGDTNNYKVPFHLEWASAEKTL